MSGTSPTTLRRGLGLVPRRAVRPTPGPIKIPVPRFDSTTRRMQKRTHALRPDAEPIPVARLHAGGAQPCALTRFTIASRQVPAASEMRTLPSRSLTLLRARRRSLALACPPNCARNSKIELKVKSSRGMDMNGVSVSRLIGLKVNLSHSALVTLSQISPGARCPSGTEQR